MTTTQSPSEGKLPQILGTNDQQCPHKHFKIEIIDRTILSRRQHLNLLCTPKGYVWVVKKPTSHQEYGTVESERKTWLRKVKCMGKKRKSKRAAFYNILAEIWKLLTPEMVTSLKNMLVNQFGMTEEEALRYICEQRAYALARREHHLQSKEPDATIEELEKTLDERLPRLYIDKKPCDPKDFAIKIDPCDVRELSRVVATKLTNYVIFMMNAKRDKRQKKIAKVILEDLCKMTGEHCTLSNPKNRLQKVMAFGADRMALWLAQNLKHDKPNERQMKKEDDELKKKHQKKLKEKEWRDEEFKRLAKGAERRRQKDEKDREEAEKKMNEEKEKKKKADEERRSQLRPGSREKGGGDKAAEKGNQKPKGTRPATGKPTGKSKNEKKADAAGDNKPKPKPETKKPVVKTTEGEDASESEEETGRGGNEETTAEAEEDVPNPKKEEAEEGSGAAPSSEAESEGENESKSKKEVPEVSSEENQEGDEDSGIGKTPKTGETEDAAVEESNEEDVPLPEKPKAPEKDGADDAKKSPEDKVLEKAASIMAATKPVETPRQEALKDVISKELERRIKPTDDETADQIRKMSSKVATWVDKSLMDVENEYGERPKVQSPVAQRPKGALFSVRKSEDHYRVRRATNAEAEKKVRLARGNALEESVSPNNAKAWTQWALEASKMAESWGRWIDKTVQEAQEKTIKYKYNGKQKGKRIEVDGEDWNTFKDKTTKEAAVWRQNKKALEEVAQLWKQRMGKPTGNS